MRKVREKRGKRGKKKWGYIKLEKIVLGDKTKKIISLENSWFASCPNLSSFFYCTFPGQSYPLGQWTFTWMNKWNNSQRISIFFHFLVPIAIARAYKAVLCVLLLSWIPFYFFFSKLYFFLLITIRDQKIAFYALKQLAIRFSWVKKTLRE